MKKYLDIHIYMSIISTGTAETLNNILFAKVKEKKVIKNCSIRFFLFFRKLLCKCI